MSGTTSRESPAVTDEAKVVSIKLFRLGVAVTFAVAATEGANAVKLIARVDRTTL